MPFITFGLKRIMAMTREVSSSVGFGNCCLIVFVLSGIAISVVLILFGFGLIP